MTTQRTTGTICRGHRGGGGVPPVQLKPDIIRYARANPAATNGEIAATVGASTDWTARTLRAARLTRRIGRPVVEWPKEVLDKCQMMIEAGSSATEVCKAVGHNRRTVFRHLHRAGMIATSALALDWQRRRYQALVLVRQKKTKKEIAAALGITERHAARLIDKMRNKGERPWSPPTTDTPVSEARP